MEVRVVGAVRLADTAGQAARMLEDLTVPNAAAARQLAAASKPPRRTGRLAGSATITAEASGAVLSWAAVYAGVIHYGWAARHIAARPWTDQAINATTGAIAAPYEAYAAEALAQIKGA